MFNKILCLASALLVMAACNSVVLNEEVQSVGYLSVSLGTDDEVTTKAVVAPSQDMAFRIEVYKGTELVTEVADHRTVSQSAPIVLRVGKYKVKAVYGDNQAGFDAPYYVGETEVTITKDDFSTADITCTLANVMVTVDFEQSIKDNFKSYSVFVEDGTGAGITFSSTSANLDAVGYIPATGTLKWKLTLVNNEGENYVANDAYTDVKARQHYDLKFGLSENVGAGGYAAIKLVVDNTLIEQEFEIELDFSESELPKVSTNDGFDLTNEMSVLVGDTSKKELTFNAAEGIRSFVLALDDEVQTRASDMVWYELVEASPDVISALAAKGIKTASIQHGATSVVIDITDYVSSLPTGNFNIDATLYDYKGHVVKCPMDFSVISDVDADMVSLTPWAKFAIAKGKYFAAAAPEGTTFMYKKVSDAAWMTLSTSAITINSASKTFEAEIGDLQAGADYVIKAVSAADVNTREVEFRTESAETLYNMSFDDWYKSGQVWYPYAQGANPSVWDSANPGAADFIGSSTTPAEGSDAIKGKAARMESMDAIITFAAGNLFVGSFVDISGIGAKLKWGVPFTSRPVALRGWYKYSPKTINAGEKAYKGQMDKAQITIALADWTAPFDINTTDGKFVDFSADYIIAYGRLESSDAYSEYVEFTIPLEYRSLTKIPKYIVISAASSYLGDYFTGGEGSTLYVDEFSFEYDVTKLTDQQKAKVHYK